ncbi:type IV toxin-antitoxin system AbiEi family antitoxin domain-containing protein [Micromonospora sp. LH3U1]|uniref:type IV toxin-antitoxin system AbiEi family antitoxin domain-containing protein n=1 Tax=Micromonospora sp. LH3U1 TaxID=3018339 RepID=UPI00234A70A6|nr:type IV toxin-antitoxin system AbiEi family antitoxin domain-containing protein [Micromonospora sp. LH3U1]WCN81679.1 type IV toxin-antitoxin system AbiEi family antitoxin domain-containing protein [Micromonospora sp. LH3U1]
MGPHQLLRNVAAGQDGMVTLEQALRAGLTRDQVRQLHRSGRWQRLLRGCFVPDAELSDSTLRRARIRAAVVSLGPGAFAVLDTALELHGIAGLRRTSQVHVSVPVDRPRPQRALAPWLTVHQVTVGSGDIAVVAGVCATAPLRTVSDVVLRVARYPAVSVLDSALNQGRINAEQLAAIPSLIRGRRGAVAARACLAEADGRAQSPLETRSRLRCVDGRVPPDTLQLEVRDDDGYLLGIGDLGWRGPRVIAEADGRDAHGTPEAAFADRRRQNRLVNAGWTILRFTWQDTLHPNYIPQTVRQAIAAAQRR